MLNGQKIVVVMPAYNAARTLQRTYDEVMAQGIVDLVIVVDDASHDETVAIARTLKDVQVEVHPENRGYGGNQKTCYRLALAAGADIVVMIHPDYQYTPQLLPAMASLVASGLYPCVLASRILGGGALDGGMPWWKYIANRFLTAVENFLIGAKLSEYHTGYRAFARTLLERVPIQKNSDDFVFDNQMLAQIVWLNSKIGEVTFPAKYMPDCQIFGLKSGGHHFTNVVLHNVGAILLFLVFRGMTGSIWRSAFVGAIFAIHPMRVESVAWIAERKDVLSGVFFMLTLGAYLRYVRAPGISRYLTLSIFLACGLMSKATFVAVPLVLLLLDYWPLGRRQNSAVRGQRSEIQIWLSLIAEK